MAATVRHGARRRKTIFARLSSGGEVVRAADRAGMVWCPRHLHEQSPLQLFARAKKAQKNIEHRDTAPLMQELKIYSDGRLLPSFFYSSSRLQSLCSGELWSILVVRPVHSADVRSQLCHVFDAPYVAYSTGCSRVVTDPATLRQSIPRSLNTCSKNVDDSANLSETRTHTEVLILRPLSSSSTCLPLALPSRYSWSRLVLCLLSNLL